MKISVSPASPTQLLLLGTSHLVSDNLPNMTLLVQDNGQYDPAIFYIDTNLSNSGTIILQSTGDSPNVSMYTQGYTFKNSTGGVVQMNAVAGSNSELYFDTDLINNGSITQSAGIFYEFGSIDGSGSLTMGPNTSLTATHIRQGSFSSAGSVRDFGTDSNPSIFHDLSITGTMDAGWNSMIVDYTGASPIDTIAGYLATGYNGGDWNGSPGINSSIANYQDYPRTALGYAESSDLFSAFPATFVGQSVDSTAVLVRYTIYGDANLDRTVDTTDFNMLTANFSQGGKRWSQGDFNYDRSVNTIDFNVLASGFGGQLSSASSAAALSPSARPATRGQTFGDSQIVDDSIDEIDSLQPI